MVPDEAVHVRWPEPDSPPELDGRETSRSGQGVDVWNGQPQPPGRFRSVQQPRLLFAFHRRRLLSVYYVYFILYYLLYVYIFFLW